MNRRVIWQRRARDDLAEIALRDRRAAERINVAVNRYAETGQADLRKLEGNQDLWRLRVGNFRVIFRFDEGGLVLLIIRVRNRREAYRD